jgi:hypothetical protein
MLAHVTWTTGPTGEAEAVEALLDGAADRARPFGGYLGFGAASPAGVLATRLERSVFVESFGTTEAEHDEAYRPYDEQSLFLVVIDHVNGVTAGAARVVVPGDRPQKTLADLELLWGAGATELDAMGFGLEPSPVWDVATLAVASAYRSPLIGQALHQLVCRTATLAGVRRFVTILDTRVYRLFRRQLRDLFIAFPTLSPLMYGGSLSVPCWCDLEVSAGHLRSVDPNLYELLFEGTGLEHAVAPPPRWRWSSDAGQPVRVPPDRQVAEQLGRGSQPPQG